METQLHARFADSPLLLTAHEIEHLQGLSSPTSKAMPCSMRVRFMAHACVQVEGNGLKLTPRGRTALLLGHM
jgi:hypothetical protein